MSRQLPSHPSSSPHSLPPLIPPLPQELTPEIESLYEELSNIPEIKDTKDDGLLGQLAKCVVPLWRMEAIKAGLEKFDSGGVSNSSNDYTWAFFFLDNAEAICRSDYEVTKEDVLKVRRETSGSQDLSFQ